MLYEAHATWWNAHQPARNVNHFDSATVVRPTHAVVAIYVIVSGNCPTDLRKNRVNLEKKNIEKRSWPKL